MPVIKVEMLLGRSAEQKAELARSFTDQFVKICGGTAESVNVVFSDYERHDWAIAGQLLSAPKRDT